MRRYVYDLRNKLSDVYSPFIKEADRDKLREELTAMEDWLYDEVRADERACYPSMHITRVNCAHGRPVREPAATFVPGSHRLETSVPPRLCPFPQGEDTTKSVYTSKLDELKAKGYPVERRWVGATAAQDALLETHIIPWIWNVTTSPMCPRP